MTKYRVEAEVDSEDYAHILKETIEQTVGCRLTAFEPGMSDSPADKTEERDS